jgi:protein-tyrosine phosphatase
VRCPGAVNMRDMGGLAVLGGWTLRGRMFRSGSLALIDGEGSMRIASVIGTYVDLRTDEELQRAGRCRALADAGVETLHVPLPGVRPSAGPSSPRWQTPILVDAYLSIVERASTSIRRIFEIMADPPRPGVCFGCTAGKDRTGVVAALLLLGLGVSAREVVSDYALTTRYFRDHPGVLAPLLRSRHRDGADDAYRMVARSSTMVMFLERLHARYHDVDRLGRAIGLAPDLFARLRRRLLFLAPEGRA